MPGSSLVETLHTRLVETAEVIVCGAGPAGFAAAISAARQGARTTLIEQHGCLGGVWTAGALSWILDYKNKGGIMQEIKDNLQAAGAWSRDEKFTSAYDVEIMKVTLDAMAMAEGIRVRLHTRVVAALVDESGRLRHIITESKSGREAWEAKLYVDATGDGDLAAQAGCGFDLGAPDTGRMQPMSLMALITGIRAGEVTPYITDQRNHQEAKSLLLHLLKRQGCSPSYAAPTLFRIHADLFALMANHQYGVSALSADDLTQATIEARREISTIIEALRKSGPPWDHVRLVATGAQIGVREGRRIHGRYRVTRQDLEEGRRHDDAICTVTFCVDIHSLSRTEGGSYGNGGVQVQAYQIPLRAAIAAGIDGLMMAGRCISGDFIAHASYRVTGNAVQMGEVVGKVAALCVQNDTLPQDLTPAVRRKIFGTPVSGKGIDAECAQDIPSPRPPAISATL